MKFYALGGVAGLGGSLLLALLLEYFKPGVKTSAEIEVSFGLPVVGFVPLVSQRKTPRRFLSTINPWADAVIIEPQSHLDERPVRSMRVHLQLSSASSKVFFISSSLPGEGKSTAAMLLAASCASFRQENRFCSTAICACARSSGSTPTQAPTRLVRLPRRHSQAHRCNHSQTQ